MRAWHFVAKTLRDGSPIPPDGEWLQFTGTCKICKSGLHASKEPWDAFQYAPGSVLCLVEVEQIVAEQKDKLVCRARKIIKRIDVEEFLFEFARKQALKVIHLWDAPEVVKRFLVTGDKSLIGATQAAARAAAQESAWNATQAAARAAAWNATQAATHIATQGNTWDVTWAAIWDVARKEFNIGVYKLFEVNE